ncbi:oligoendopeptidase F [Alphaproteobacteria bacterium]|nr:oligoendopeptidase F [Alphaproteobacteria bacterium]
MNTWQLEDIYSSAHAKELSSDCELVERLIEDFCAKHKNKLTIDALQESIVDYETIINFAEKIGGYAFLQLQTRLDNHEALTFFQEKTEWLCEVSSRLVFFCNDIARLDKKKVEASIERSEILKKYESWISNCFRYQPHLLSNEAEEALAKKFMTSSNSWIRMFDEILACLQFNFEGEEKTFTELLEIANHSDNEEKRARAAKSISEKLTENSFYFKHIYNNVMLDRRIENKLRNYEKPESFRNLSNNIDQASVDFLVEAIESRYEQTSHRYYALKAKILGKQKLEYWDRNISIKLSNIFNKKFDYKAAAGLVLETFCAFSPIFADIASDFINKNWIDVYPKLGKTSGAFACSCSTSVHPYILLNYFDTIRDVSTLAHELGHGIHQVLAAKNGALLAETPITLAELASLFAEKLLFEKLFANAETIEEKIDLLCWRLDDTINSTIRQISFFKFERDAHELRSTKELFVEDLSEIFLKNQRKCLGNSVNVDECVGIYWTYISHFFHSPFYVYAYAFGEIFVNALYKNYKKFSDNFVEKYIKMLSKGGIDRYDIAAQTFDLDPSKKEFWKDGVDEIEAQINYLENLYNGLLCN